MPLSPAQTKVLEAVLTNCKENLRMQLHAFRDTPAGQLVSAAGKRYIEIKNEGRDVTEDDIAEFATSLSEVLQGRSPFPQQNEDEGG